MPTDQEYRNVLRDTVRGLSGFEIRPDAPVDRETNGAWVQVWMLVDNEEIGDQGPYGVGA